jgi:hypothetical protein
VTARAKLLLGILGAVLLAAAWNQVRSAPAPGGGSAAPEERLEGRAAGRRASRGRRAQEEAPLAVEELRIAGLEPSAGSFEPGRNPFAFYVAPPPPPPVPRGPTPEELQAQREAAERERLAALEAARAAPPRPTPPPIDFSYLGSFGPPAKRVAVFRSGAGGLLNARVGDVLNGKFRLVAIGYESVDIEYVGFPDLPPEQVAVGEEGT